MPVSGGIYSPVRPPQVDTSIGLAYYSPYACFKPGKAGMRFRTRISIVGILVSIIAALLSAMLTAGSDVRMVLVLTIFFSGFAGGASLTALISSLKHRNREDGG
jgi:hypothetical protein